MSLAFLRHMKTALRTDREWPATLPDTTPFPATAAGGDEDAGPGPARAAPGVGSAPPEAAPLQPASASTTTRSARGLDIRTRYLRCRRTRRLRRASA